MPDSSMPPHFLNLQLLSASVSETIRIREMHLKGVEFDSDVVDSGFHLRQLDKLVRECTQNMESHLLAIDS